MRTKKIIINNDSSEPAKKKRKWNKARTTSVHGHKMKFIFINSCCGILSCVGDLSHFLLEEIKKLFQHITTRYLYHHRHRHYYRHCWFDMGHFFVIFSTHIITVFTLYEVMQFCSFYFLVVCLLLVFSVVPFKYNLWQ